MTTETKRKQSFLLRLPISVREQANRIALADGTSLNHFITLAVAEKLSRMKGDQPPPGCDNRAFNPRPARFDPSSFIHARVS